MRTIAIALITFGISLVVFRILSDFGAEFFTHRTILRRFCCEVFTHNDKEFTIAATVVSVGISLLTEGN